MNILVIGCGKVGSQLASMLSEEGHDVSVVDRDAKNFEMLDDSFSGMTTVGVPIDQDVLKQAAEEYSDGNVSQLVMMAIDEFLETKGFQKK